MQKESAGRASAVCCSSLSSFCPGTSHVPKPAWRPHRDKLEGDRRAQSSTQWTGQIFIMLGSGNSANGQCGRSPNAGHREGRGLAARQPKGMVSSAAATRCYWPQGPQVCFPLCWTSSVLDHFSSLWRPLLSPHLLLGWRKECLPGTPRHLCLSE